MKFFMTRTRLCLVLISLVVSTMPAAAQQESSTPIPSTGASSPAGSAPLTPDRPVEIGLEVGGVLTWGGGGGDVRLAATLPVTDRSSIEAFAGKFGGADFVDTKGVYGVRVKRFLDKGREPGVEPFMTFGAMGIVAHDTEYGCSGSKCGYQPSTRVTPPILFVCGVGADFKVQSRMTVRFEVQGGTLFLFPVTLRLAVGVTVPLGRVPKHAGREGSR